jgi:hypothetical protein
MLRRTLLAVAAIAAPGLPAPLRAANRGAGDIVPAVLPAKACTGFDEIDVEWRA